MSAHDSVVMSFVNLRENRNAYRYAWRNGPRWAFEYLREGRIVAACRQLWNSFIHGHISESCQECGRMYSAWTADHDVYERVTGYKRYENGEWATGWFCHDCFHHKARSKGIFLRWKPEVEHES